MRSIVALLVSCSLFCATLAPATAAADKTLQNLKGDVSFQAPGGAKTAIGAKASIALSDAYSAITGANSEGAIGLPDSSRVLVGQNTNVQLASFDQAGIATANFVLVNGKTRFAVQHPAGARANYTFKTDSAQIAVRGTTGDISWDTAAQTLQVNVYDLTDPTLPVQVTLADGELFSLSAGQTLLVHFPLDPAAPPQVRPLTHPLFDTFAEFGLPDNARQLGLLPPGNWFGRGGWLVLVPIILILTNHHPNDTPPTAGNFPVGINGTIHTP